MSNEHDQHPAYALLTSTFNAGLVTFVSQKKTRRRFAKGIPWQDLALLGVATHKVTRILTKDRVTETIRSPVTTGEKQRQPTGEGMQRALGELVTCPYCTAPWIALGLSAAYVAYPTQTRAASAVLGIVAVSDYLNRIYTRVSKG